MLVELDDVAHYTRSPRALEKRRERRLAGLTDTQQADSSLRLSARYFANSQLRSLPRNDGRARLFVTPKLDQLDHRSYRTVPRCSSVGRDLTVSGESHALGSIAFT